MKRVAVTAKPEPVTEDLARQVAAQVAAIVPARFYGQVAFIFENGKPLRVKIDQSFLLER